MPTEPPKHTPQSRTTESEEVTQLAKRWLKDCEKHTVCQSEGQTSWWPTRLLDIRPPEEGKQTDLRLVLTKNLEEDVLRGSRYVTLSHRWGDVKITRLKKGNIKDFQKGVNLTGLPKTFRDAINFARRLEDVRYIWVDSLCIIQDDEKDWLEESAAMNRVYKGSYLNISATAAKDSEEGLFFNRDPKVLWEEFIDLNIDGIPGQGKNDSMQRCSILDLSFWQEHVDDAPVNKRGWVIQERLLSPRVLHFTKDQIAWECCRFRAAEHFPEGVPSFRLRSGVVVDEGSLKGFVPDVDGKRLRELRLDEKPDLDKHLCPEIYVYELWKRVVEMYTRTSLSKSKDKLIALSGVAKAISDKIQSSYIAGLWKKHLASQLLWRVDPEYKHRSFRYPSNRPSGYRAPSFSWAALDASQGITYGDVTDKGILIEVLSAECFYPPENFNEFGLVEGGHCFVAGLLKKIVIEIQETETETSYGWRLLEDTENKKKKPQRNIYLDSPHCDTDIFGPDGQVYCLPAAIGERTQLSKHLICLLLQSAKGESIGTFKRVGLAKVADYELEDQERLQEVSGGEENMPHLGWDRLRKRHTIRII